MAPLTVRPFAEDDAEDAEALLQEAFAGFDEEFPGSDEALVQGVLLMAQTGHRFLIADRDGQLAGVVRWHDDEGIAWFDLLAAGVAWAGRELVRAVEQGAQDRGLRLVRTRVPDATRLEDYFARFGYVGVSRETPTGARSQLVMEKRLPLLTVREQRRSDAGAIEALTGEDAWVYTQGARPGAFVVADGDRVVGFIAARDAGGGLAELRVPVLLAAYRGRGLEAWMLERAGFWAETNGYHSAAVPADGSLRALERDLEDRRWLHDGDVYMKRFVGVGDTGRRRTLADAEDEE